MVKTKAPKLSKRVRRELSADEALYRYHLRLQRHLDEQQHREWRLARVVCKRDGVDHVLCVRKVLRTRDGIYLEVE